MVLTNGGSTHLSQFAPHRLPKRLGDLLLGVALPQEVAELGRSSFGGHVSGTDQVEREELCSCRIVSQGNGSTDNL